LQFRLSLRSSNALSGFIAKPKDFVYVQAGIAKTRLHVENQLSPIIGSKNNPHFSDYPVFCFEKHQND
jgi:hypothetical protein